MENTKQILLIEDNKHDQFFFIQAINKIESATLFHIANNGKEALDKLRSCDTLPDLIFTDIHMPVMDGIEYLSETNKIPLIRDIPVVVLSSDSSKIESISHLGAKAFIEKPDDINLLKKLVEYVLNMVFVTEKTAIDYQGFTFIRPNINYTRN